MEVMCVPVGASHKKACDSSVSHGVDAKFDPLVKSVPHVSSLESPSSLCK